MHTFLKYLKYFFRTLYYIKNGLSQRVIDSTPDKKWSKLKAKKMSVILYQPSIKFLKEPTLLKNDICDLRSFVGWSKSLHGLPKFTTINIDQHFYKVNQTVCSSSTVVKKSFTRGQQFLEENYIDIGSIYTKENSMLFCLKGVCGASLKKDNRWIILAIEKASCNVQFAYCQCPAGKSGTCAHSYALMKILAKWVIDNIREVPDPVACTSRPCAWSVPQSRGRIEKRDIMSISIVSPEAKRRKFTVDNDEGEQTRTRMKGIECTLYEPRSINMVYDDNKTKELIEN